MDAGTAFVLWMSVPIEVKIERKGSRKVYLSAKKIDWMLEQNVKVESQQALSALAAKD